MAGVGLEYQKYGSGVVVTGPGTCLGEDLVIPFEAEGLLVAGVGGGAFKGVKGVKSVTLPEGLEYIGDEAFYGYASLKSVTIGSGMTSIGPYAFYVRSALTHIYDKGSSSEGSNISIGANNGYLTSATIYYYSETEPADDGNFWHASTGQPAVWGIEEQISAFTRGGNKQR